MAQLIKNQTATVDSWNTLKIEPDQSPESIALPHGEILFPLAVWQARKREIISTHKRIGLLLQAGDRVEDIADDLEYFIVIAIDFPKFVDGRAYSTATLLRQRYHFEGELRAVGDVLHDQLYFMQRVGFDSYALKDGKDIAQALKNGFNVFSETYQTASSQPQPYFRRRSA